MAEKMYTAKDFSARCVLNKPLSIQMFGPSGAGKSTLLKALLNDFVYQYISEILSGINNQTSRILISYLFNSKISTEKSYYYKVYLKKLDRSEFLQPLENSLFKVFYKHRLMSENVLQVLNHITDETVKDFLNPETATYNISKYADEVKTDEFVKAVKKILEFILEKFEETHKIKLNEKSKNKVTKSNKSSNKENVSFIKGIFGELFYDAITIKTQEEDLNELEYLFDKIESMINEDLRKVSNLVIQDSYFEVEGYNEDGLLLFKELVDTRSPFSLIIEKMDFYSKPHMEFINHWEFKGIENTPINFTITDSMGFTQTGLSLENMEETLEGQNSINFNNSDAALLVLNIQTDKTSINNIRLVVESKLKQYKNPLFLCLTSLDTRVKNALEQVNVRRLTPDIAKEHIPLIYKSAIEYGLDMGRKFNLTEEYVKSLSLHEYRDSDLIMQGLDIDESMNFKFDGIYKLITDIIVGTYKFLSPTDDVILIETIDPTKSPVNIKFVLEPIINEISQIQNLLDTFYLNQYYTNILQTHALYEESLSEYSYKYKQFMFATRSVNTYFNKLANGDPHTTNAGVYANFSLNMSGILLNALNKSEISNILSNQQFVWIDNFTDKDVLNSSKALGVNESLEVLKKLKTDVLSDMYAIFREVANNLAYQNLRVFPKVREKMSITSKHHALVNLQIYYKEFFNSEQFQYMILEELRVSIEKRLSKKFYVI